MDRGSGADWVDNRVLESIKAGKRLPEARFSTMRIAAKGQKSVYGMFKRVETGSDENFAAPRDMEGSTGIS